MADHLDDLFRRAVAERAAAAPDPRPFDALKQEQIPMRQDEEHTPMPWSRWRQRNLLAVAVAVIVVAGIGLWAALRPPVGSDITTEPISTTSTTTDAQDEETKSVSTTSTTASTTSATTTRPTTPTNSTVPTTAEPGPTVPQRSWKDDPIVAQSPVCVPADLPAGLDHTAPIYFRKLGDPTDKRLDLITSSAVYTAVDCTWVAVLDLEREPGVSDWRCQDYEDGSAVELWNFSDKTVTEFPAGGGSAPMENYERPGQLFGLASCDRSDPRNDPPSV